MKITVAICTWNRASLLEKTLEQMIKLSIPNHIDFEIIIVNNNCSDNTDEIIKKYTSVLPIRQLLETRQGLSNARNCAIDYASGDYLIWTDDDVLVDSGWLAAYVRAFRAFPHAAFYGGPITPWYASEPPRWVNDHINMLSGPFVILDLGRAVRPLQDDEEPFGANMAFRMEILRETRFDPALGRLGKSLVGYDEVEMIRRLRFAGLKGIWVGDAFVRHYIPNERISINYIERWFEGEGRTMLRMDPNIPGARVGGVPRWMYRNYGIHRLRSFFYFPWRGRRWFESFRAAAQMRGKIAESKDRWSTQDHAVKNL